VTGPYRYEKGPGQDDYRHVRPVTIELQRLTDDELTAEMRSMRRYRGRLRRLTRHAEEDLARLVGAYG
jgi:hypothetical protein